MKRVGLFLEKNVKDPETKSHWRGGFKNRQKDPV